VEKLKIALEAAPVPVDDEYVASIIPSSSQTSPLQNLMGFVADYGGQTKLVLTLTHTHTHTHTHMRTLSCSRELISAHDKHNQLIKHVCGCCQWHAATVRGIDTFWFRLFGHDRLLVHDLH
jgi:hypothetical protein